MGSCQAALQDRPPRSRQRGFLARAHRGPAWRLRFRPTSLIAEMALEKLQERVKKLTAALWHLGGSRTPNLMR